jgi:predicted nuclease of predicted toxin-antitoxin system
MKFLVDNQLPTALARFLSAEGLEAVHVRDLAMDKASDQVIWAFAKSQGFTVISKDEDFLYLANMDSDSHALVWVRLGNCRREALLDAFRNILPELVKTLEAGTSLVEIR